MHNRKMNCKLLLILLMACGWLSSCIAPPKQVLPAREELCIYPDYQEVTLPVNIAPLNFLVREATAEAVSVCLKGVSDSLTVTARGANVTFPLKAWKRVLQQEVGHCIQVRLDIRKQGKWYRYPIFHWKIVADSLDSYLSYRLIEPGYEVWNALQIRERCVENFEEKVLADNHLTEGKCMNCHIYGANSGDLSLFHLRGEGGGTLLNRNGTIRKLKLKSDDMQSGATYGSFHPSGRFAVFSSNTVLPALHTQGSQRLEVFDTASDLLIVDFDTQRIIQSNVVADASTLETFPTFSADGKAVYFCTAPLVSLPDSVKQLRYSLCRIPFDATRGSWGEQIDTLWSASAQNGSVCHPKASPDGKYLLYTVAHYGTFPIWHRETNLQLMQLETGAIDSLQQVNSDRSDTYHSWSSNSRWFTFASKRGDGQYGRIYFAYVDADGAVHKPFALPQKEPTHDDMNLKSYNLPELSRSSAPFHARDIEQAARLLPAEPFTKEL
ncbi:MAG: TolB family protein [Phocaeicola sp.]